MRKPEIVDTIRGMFEEKAWLSWTRSNGSETSAITEFNTEIYRLCAD